MRGIVEAAIQIRQWINGISIYKDTQEGPLYAFKLLMDNLNKPLDQVSEYYTNFYYTLISKEPSGSWADYLFHYVLTSENAFSLECAKGKFLDTQSGVRMAAKTDLDYLENLSKIKSTMVKEILFDLYGEDNKVILRLPDWMNTFTKFQVDGSWGDNLLRMAEHYKENGYGIFSVANVFDVNERGHIVPVTDLEKTKIEEVERNVVRIKPIFDKLQNGQVTNTYFTGDNQQLAKLMLYMVQSPEYARVKLIGISQSAMAHFANVCEYLSRTPGYFIVFPDNFSRLLETNRQEMFTYIKRSAGLQVDRQNITLFASGQDLPMNEQEWFHTFLHVV